MAYKLAVQNTVTVPVKFSLADGGQTKTYAFTLQCERVDGTEWDNALKNEDGIVTNEKIFDQVLSITNGWADQKLVLDDEGEPAKFCKEAFEVMLGVPGVLDVIVKSYMKESAAKAKN